MKTTVTNGMDPPTLNTASKMPNSDSTAIYIKITLLGIDLAKNFFQLHGVDDKGKEMLRKRITRDKLVETIANIPKCSIVMVACGGANYWCRNFLFFGHTPKLIIHQFVKPFCERQ